jgi:hypothetical protein
MAKEHRGTIKGGAMIAKEEQEQREGNMKRSPSPNLSARSNWLNEAKSISRPAEVAGNEDKHSN